MTSGHINDRFIEMIRTTYVNAPAALGEDPAERPPNEWPANRFEWRNRTRLPGDQPLTATLSSIDMEEIDWDLIMFWNDDLARASWTLYNTPTLLASSLWSGAKNAELVKQITARLPRSERRAIDTIEPAVSHVLRSVEDQAGRPFRIYDPATGIWRQEGEWINEALAGVTVMNRVDSLIGSFEMALHRAVDFLTNCVDCALPKPQKPAKGASDTEVNDYTEAMNDREELMAPINEVHKYARGISRGTYRKLRDGLRSRLAVKQTLWDSDSKWLVLRDGMIDVEEVYRSERIELRAFSPFVYSTLAVDVAWGDATRNAGISEWEKGVIKVLPDADVRRYLQKRYGAALLGTPAVAAKSMVWQWGRGDTAKSTLQECIAGARGVFANYSIQFSSAVLTSKGAEKGTGDLFKAYARGKRFAIMSEMAEGEMLDSETLKSLTGGDTVTGTAKYSNSVSYFFTATLFMASNHSPRLPPGDPQSLLRIHVVPFTHKLWVRSKNPEDWEKASPEHRADEDWQRRVLDSRQERAAIFRWVLDGLVAFGREGGLGELPEAMVDSRETFAEESDPSAKLARAMLGKEPSSGPAWAEIYSDEEWKAMGLHDGDGILQDRMYELLKIRAEYLGLWDSNGQIPRRLVLNARSTLSDMGGNWKKVSVPGTQKKVSGMSRMRELSL